MDNIHDIWPSNKNEEFQEEDIWEIFQDNKNHDSRVKHNSFKEPSLISKNLQTPTKIMIPKSNKFPTFHHSAPVNIPDWSKIYGTTSKKNSKSAYDQDVDQSHDVNNVDRRFGSWESDDDDDEDEDGNLLPPHELVARKLARKQISSFSVCEGAGRTLKGRDLSRVRNAVLTKTGFLESKSDYYYY